MSKNHEQFEGVVSPGFDDPEHLVVYRRFIELAAEEPEAMQAAVKISRADSEFMEKAGKFYDPNALEAETFDVASYIWQNKLDIQFEIQPDIERFLSSDPELVDKLSQKREFENQTVHGVQQGSATSDERTLIKESYRDDIREIRLSKLIGWLALSKEQSNQPAQTQENDLKAG